jgi:hypothetical protein
MNSYKTVSYPETDRRVKKVYERNGSYSYRAKHPLWNNDWWIPMSLSATAFDLETPENLAHHLRHVDDAARAMDEFVDSPECLALVSRPEVANGWDLGQEGDPTAEDVLAETRALLDELETHFDTANEDGDRDPAQAFRRLVYITVLMKRNVELLVDHVMPDGPNADDENSTLVGYGNAWNQLAEAAENEANKTLGGTDEYFAALTEDEWEAEVKRMAEYPDYIEWGRQARENLLGT